jgi:hypothetical protein
MKKLACLVLGLPFAVGCGTDTLGPETLPDLMVPAPPSNGLQILTPIFDNIQPGADDEVCTWTDVVLDHDIDVRSGAGYQTEPPGHHIVVYYTFEKQPPGTQRICNDTDMATFRFLIGAGGEGENVEAPGNLVYRVPAGAQLVLNHHYLNVTDQTLRGQSLINLNFADPGQTYVPAGNLAFVNTSLTVAQGDTSQDMHAVIDQTYKIWHFVPHMHQWGKHTSIKITQAGQSTTLFDVDWDPSYTFHPPEKKVDPATPMMLNAGDTVDIHCEWNNDSGRDLAFGFEMCVGFANTVDDNNTGSRAWDDGTWGPF